MVWRNVIISHHCKISSKLESLLVQTIDNSYQIPLSDLDMVLIESPRAMISTHALAQLCDRNIAVIFCDERMQPMGQIMPFNGTDSQRAHILNQMQWQKERKDILWQSIVKAKICNQAYVLAQQDVADYDDVAKLADQVVPGDKNNREAVAAHMYFPRLFSYEFTRGDDENPINSVLNYGYAILMSEVARQISVNGYLCHFGIHHDNVNNQWNFPCDLMEPFRPIVDRFVIENELKEINPETKRKLVDLLLAPCPEYHTSLSLAIGKYVHDCIAYLNGNENLPTVEMEQ